MTTGGEALSLDPSGLVELTRGPERRGCFGRADPVRQSRVTGWFVSDRECPVIEAFIDGLLAGRAAIAPSSEPIYAAPENAQGFSFQIPRLYQDGRPHILTLVLDDGSSLDFLGGNGATLQYLRFRFELPDDAERTVKEDQWEAARTHDMKASPFVGRADLFSGTAITGWAASLSAPNKPTFLAMFIDGEPAGNVICDRPSSAARDIGLSGITGGFRYAIPERFLDGVTHSLSARFGDGSPLVLSDDGSEALRFTIEAVTSIDGVVDGLVGDSIRGWAIRRNLTSGSIAGNLAIQVLCNGVIVGEVTADQPRIDVARELQCDLRVGFLVRVPEECRNGQEFLFSLRVLPERQELTGSPLSIRCTSSESDRELRTLAHAIDQLCTDAFKLQHQVRDLLPAADATVANYDAWARRYQTQLRSRMSAAPGLPEQLPLVSVVMPTFRTNLAHLTAAIESVRGQSYPNWELVIVDDGSDSAALAACIRSYAEMDERITGLFNKRNRGISAATNSALGKAKGAFVVFMDHDDLMVDVALEALVREALRTGACIIYSDEDKIDDFGVFSEPNLKPDWNYRLLLGVNYICHLLMVDRHLLKKTGPMRSECDGAQDHDLLLRISENCEPEQIVHLPEILYHWRKTANSTASSGAAKHYAVSAGQRAVAEHLVRRGFKRSVVTAQNDTTTYAVSWGLTEQRKVSIIIPFKDQADTTRRCLESLLASTEWHDWQVVLVDNGSESEEAATFCREAVENSHVSVYRVDEPFNFARLNNLAARAYPADYYVFLNNDIFLDQPGWLRLMMDEAIADPKVAIVGAKLLYPNGTVQHAGVVLGVGGVADHAFKGAPADDSGYMSRAQCAQQYSAVTAACMLCRADVFLDLGGFDEQQLAVAFNDIDLCLKARKHGWRVMWTPAVVAEHHESLSRGDDLVGARAARFFYENYVMFQRWHRELQADQFYNPHFSRDRGVFLDLR